MTEKSFMLELAIEGTGNWDSSNYPDYKVGRGSIFVQQDE